MKSIAWAIIIASIHMAPPLHPNEERTVLFGFIILFIYISAWVGFLRSNRSGS